jgi:hypothetical protein
MANKDFFFNLHSFCLALFSFGSGMGKKWMSPLELHQAPDVGNCFVNTEYNSMAL